MLEVNSLPILLKNLPSYGDLLHFSKGCPCDAHLMHLGSAGRSFMILLISRRCDPNLYLLHIRSGTKGAFHNSPQPRERVILSKTQRMFNKS